MPKKLSKTAERTLDEIEEMDQDRTTGLPEEAYEQPEPYGDPKEPKGFSRGGGIAITGTKFEGVR